MAAWRARPEQHAALPVIGFLGVAQDPVRPGQARDFDRSDVPASPGLEWLRACVDYLARGDT